MKMLRLNNPKGLHQARQGLADTGALRVDFAAQGSRLPVLIVHCAAVRHYAVNPPPRDNPYYYVGLVEFGGCYPFTLGGVNWGYAKDKLRVKTDVDAMNLTALLNAVGQTSRRHLDEFLERLMMSPSDDTAVDFHHYAHRGGPL
jgi:hypothetical protein